MADVLRQPLLTRIGKVKSQAVFTAPNLLLSTLAVVVAAAPFIPSQQTEPVRKLRVQQVQQTPNTLLSVLSARPAAAEVSVPRAAKRSRQDTSQQNTLLQILLPTVPQDPFDPVDHTQPKWKRQVQETNVPNLLLSTLIPVVQTTPFLSIDQIQIKPKRLTQDTNQQNLLLSVLTPFSGPPFTARSSLERTSQKKRVQSTDHQNLLLSTLKPVVSSAPFAPIDTHQVRKKRSVQAGEQPNLILSTLIPVQEVLPPRAVIQQQVGPKRRVQDTTVINLLANPLNLPVVYDVLPPRYEDFPIPRRKARITDAFFPGVNYLIPGLTYTIDSRPSVRLTTPFASVTVYNTGGGRYFTVDYEAGGSGGGSVNSVVGTTNQIDVDSSVVSAPVLSLAPPVLSALALAISSVQSVVGTASEINVDATDPQNPVVSLAPEVLLDLVLANSAVQPADLAAIAFSGSYADLGGVPANLVAYAGGDLPSAFTLSIVDSADSAAWRAAIGAGTSNATGANPTASIGLAVVNGSASTFLRSDGAPALNQTIAPTWTGIHTFANNLIGTNVSAAGVIVGAGLGSRDSTFQVSAAGAGNAGFRVGYNSTDVNYWDGSRFYLRGSVTSLRSILDLTATALAYGNATDEPTHSFYGGVTINGPSGATPLIVNTSYGYGAKFARSGGAAFGVQLDSSNGYIGTDTNHPLAFYTNGSTRATLGVTGGWQFGSPTGGDQGAGTLNATGLFVNGVAVSTASVPTLADGTYTPTLTNTTNLSASTARACQWMRVGNVVTVSGSFNATPTVGGVTCIMGMTLPVASALAQTWQLGGGGGVEGSGNVSVAAYGDATNDRATFAFLATAGANEYAFTFSYLVV